MTSDREMQPVHEAIARLRDRCLDGWDWAYIEGSELSEENFREDLARVLEELEKRESTMNDRDRNLQQASIRQLCENLGWQSPRPQGRDAIDFRDLYVSEVADALALAWEAGYYTGRAAADDE